MDTLGIPFKLWGVVFLLVGVCFFLLNRDWSIFENDTTKSEILNTARLRENKNKYHVVALGNSLLAHGMPFDREIEQKLSQRKLHATVNRMAISGMDSDYFVSVFPQIVAARPNLILIQAEFFVLESPESNFQKNIIQMYGAGRNYFTNKKSQGGVYERNRSPSPMLKYLQEDCQDRGLPQSEIEKKGKKAYQKIRTGTNQRLDSYLSFVRQAQELGIEVVFLEIGRSKIANDMLGQKNQMTISSSLAEISLKTKAEVWRFPANLSLEYYCDLAHMNERGQHIFTDWLSDKLKAKIDSKSRNLQ